MYTTKTCSPGKKDEEREAYIEKYRTAYNQKHRYLNKDLRYTYIYISVLSKFIIIGVITFLTLEIKYRNRLIIALLMHHCGIGSQSA